MGILVQEASKLAEQAHAGQLDKAGHPYFEHVAAVRDALAPYGEEAQVAGVLHDILEDTSVTEDDLRAAGVPENAIAAIKSVSRRDGETYMTMIRRAAADPLGRLVKLADNAHNSREDRLAHLEPGNAAFLRQRYAKARAVLNGEKEEEEEAQSGRGSSKRKEHRSDAAEVRSVRAHPPALIIRWRERLGLPECPYVTRWRIETRYGSLRIHHWTGPDDKRAFHDHPWWFITLVARGSYTDRSPDGDDHLHAGSVRYRPALHRHTVIPGKDGAWTILITGPRIRTWGFWQDEKFRKARRWFESQGHHPCE